MSGKKNLPENIQKLKTQLESGNNLIDYFLVCGIDPSICLNENKLFNLTNDKNKNLSYLSKILKPKILTKFPPFDNNNDTIDDEIITYCFPYGFTPYYKDTGEKIGKHFSIILDNNLFSSDHPQKYLTCLIFYEKLSQYKSLADDIEKIKNDLDISDCRSTFFDKSLPINNLNRNSVRKEITKDNDPKKITHFKTTSTTFNINSNDNDLTSTIMTDKLSHTVEPNIEDKTLRFTSTSGSLTNKLKYYFIPKCICIVSIHPYIELFKQILIIIYKYSMSSQNQPIEKIIANLVIEVPIAPRGLYSIDFMVLNKAKTLKRTENNKLLLCEINLKKFQSNVQFHIQLEVFKHILFASKIIFFSKNINNLSETILAFISLIFPFKYPFQVTSYLSKNNYFILESVSPFIIGINEVYDAQFFVKNDVCTEGSDIFVVDLDNNLTELITNETFPELPNKIVNNLEKELRKLDEERKKNNSDIEDESFEDFNSKFQELYFCFFCELIKNYEEYLNKNYFKNAENDIVSSIETLFFCNQFIRSHSSSDIPFYTKFVNDSQLFVDFIYKRMIPKNNQEIIELLLVNDTFTKIKNKNKFFGKDDPTEFLDCEEYKRTNKYIVPNPRELTEFEKKNIKAKKEKLSTKGQIISFNNKGKNDIISFKYNIFPELDFDIYCNNENANEYCPPPDYSEEIEAININAISKSSLGESINRSLEMKNYLYLSWLEVWAFSFWYTDEKERHYRFNQMLNVLIKVKHHEMNILNLLFDALNKVGENEMLLKLYRKILDLNINPSTFIYNIISGVIDKAQMRKLKDKKKSSEKIISEDNYYYRDYNIKDNKKRTFLSLEDYLEIDTKLKFYSEFSCIQCGEKINLLNVCRTFEDVKNDILWVPCSCGEYNLPKIKVIFGRELLRDPLYKTSSKDEIVLHSPYNLKINIKDAVMNNYGTKLNVIDFKIQFKALFWDFIWYCKIHSLDYNIILPYLKDIEELKLNYNNSSNEVFEIVFDDKIYKENLNRISKHSKCIYEKFVDIQHKKDNSENYLIEATISFNIGKSKPRITLKNINVNEDEDDENDEDNDENENIKKNEKIEKNKEEKEPNNNNKNDGISKDETLKIVNISKNDNNVIKEEKKEEEEEYKENEVNNKKEENNIIKEEKNEEEEEDNSSSNEEENDNSKENEEGNIKKVEEKNENIKVEGENENIKEVEKNEKSKQIEQDNNSKGIEEENIKEIKIEEENENPKETEEENNNEQQINRNGEEEDSNNGQNNINKDEEEKSGNIEKEKIDENNNNEININIIEEETINKEENEEEIKINKEIICLKEEIKKDIDIPNGIEIKEIKVVNNMEDNINKSDEKNENIIKEKVIENKNNKYNSNKDVRLEVENSMKKIKEKAKNKKLSNKNLTNNNQNYSNKYKDENFLLTLKKKLKKVDSYKESNKNTANSTINNYKSNNNSGHKNIDPNMDYEE